MVQIKWEARGLPFTHEHAERGRGGNIMTKREMIEALKEAEVKVSTKASKAEVEALYNDTFNTEEETMNTETRTEAEVNVINSNEAHVEAEAHVTSLPINI